MKDALTPEYCVGHTSARIGHKGLFAIALVNTISYTYRIECERLDWKQEGWREKS